MQINRNSFSRKVFLYFSSDLILKGCLFVDLLFIFFNKFFILFLSIVSQTELIIKFAREMNKSSRERRYTYKTTFQIIKFGRLNLFDYNHA